MLQLTPLNGITLGQAKTAHFNQMITLTKYVSFTKYAIKRHLDLFNFSQFEPINQIIPLTVIPLSSAHCIEI